MAVALPSWYRAMVQPVPGGGGIRFCPKRERGVDLDLVEIGTFSATAMLNAYCPSGGAQAGSATAMAAFRKAARASKNAIPVSTGVSVGLAKIQLEPTQT